MGDILEGAWSSRGAWTLKLFLRRAFEDAEFNGSMGIMLTSFRLLGFIKRKEKLGDVSLIFGECCPLISPVPF